MASKIRVLIEADGKVYESELNRSTKATKQFGSETRNTAADLSHMRTAVTGVAGALAGLGLLQVARDTIQVGMEFEAINRTLETVTGNSHAAGEEMAFIRNEADRLGLQLQSTAKDYASLMASSRGTRLEGELTREIFSAIAEASAVLGLEAEQTSGALTAVEQIISKGNVSAEELRGQLGERIPGAFQVAARAMGKTTAELDKMLQLGELSAEDLLPAMAKELRRTFGTDATTRIEDTRSAFNRLQTAITDTQVALNEAGLAGIVSEMADDMTESLRDSKESLIDWADDILTILSWVMDSSKAAGGTIAAALNSAATTAESGGEQIRALIVGDWERAMQVGDEWWQQQRTIWGDLVNNSDFDRYREKLADLREDMRRGDDDGPAPDEDEGGDGGGSGLTEEQQKAIDAADKAIAKLEEELALMGQKTELEKLNAQIRLGAFEDAQPHQVERLRNLAREIDAKQQLLDLEANFKDLQEEIIEDTTRAAELERQRYQEELALLRQAEEAKLDSIVSYRELRERLEQRHHENLKEIAEEGAERELRELEEQLGDIAFAARDAFGTFEDAIIESAQAGKLAWRDMIESMLADLARLALQEQVTKPLYDALLPALGSLFSGGSPGYTTETTSEGLTNTIPTAGGHGGAVIGHEASSRHRVDPAVFDGAQRYHRGGLLGDEVPFIGRRGEGVFTEEQMKRLAPVDAANDNAPRLTVIVNNNGEPAEVERTEQRQGPGGEQIYELWLSEFGRDLNRNGRASQIMEGTYPSLRRGGARR